MVTPLKKTALYMNVNKSMFVWNNIQCNIVVCKCKYCTL